MAGHRVIWLIFILIFSIAYANIVPNEEIGKNSIEIKRLKTEMQSVVQTIVRFSFLLTYRLGGKEARRPTPKWNTRFYLAFSIRA